MKQVAVSESFKRKAILLLTAIAAFTLSVMPAAVSAASDRQTRIQSEMYAQAAKEFKVPKELLLAIAYNQSRWESHKGQMSVDGGYGPMNLRTQPTVEDARGDASRPVKVVKKAVQDLTLNRASQLLGVSQDTLKNDVKQNIRGGAAVLADQAKRLNGGELPKDVSGWSAAVAQYSGSKSAITAEGFAHDVYTTMKEGVAATTAEGQQLALLPQSGIKMPDLSRISSLLALTDNLKQGVPETNVDGAECPRTLNCRFIPAGYAANSADPADFGNYDHSSRPRDMKVQYIVIHDTEGSYNSAISHFQDTTSYVSAHYVIRSSDGAITQMVDTADTAWHAGDWYVNMHSIGIEHEGYAALGGSWYTEAMYRSSAQLVRYLAKKYDIPLDRDHIIGHDNVPGLTDARVPKMHWDPGPYWDWDHYMDLVNGRKINDHQRSVGVNSNIVTINPTFRTNVQTVQACVDSDSCADLTAPSNFVYLRVEPRADAELIGDPLLHPDGSAGTNRINDWTAKAATGQQYGLAGKQGDWTAIWFAGQKAWFYNPKADPTAYISKGVTIKLKPGVTEAHTYGGAYPEASVYPAEVPGPVQPKLSYKIKAGQAYAAYGKVPTDYFYDATIDYSKPYDHEIFRGNDKYIKIWYNQRMMYVKAADVIVSQ